MANNIHKIKHDLDTLGCALAVIGFGLAALGALISGECSTSWNYVQLGLGSIAVTAGLAVLFVAAAILTATSLVLRSVATVVSYLGRREPEADIVFQP